MSASHPRTLHLVREAPPEDGAVQEGDAVVVVDEVDPGELVEQIFAHDGVIVW